MEVRVPEVQFKILYLFFFFEALSLSPSQRHFGRTRQNRVSGKNVRLQAPRSHGPWTKSGIVHRCRPKIGIVYRSGNPPAAPRNAGEPVSRAFARGAARAPRGGAGRGPVPARNLCTKPISVHDLCTIPISVHPKRCPPLNRCRRRPDCGTSGGPGPQIPGAC